MSDLFATIPETTLPSGLVVPEFKLARYLTTVAGGRTAILPDAKPTVNISYFGAVKAAEAGAMKLITETRHAAVRQILYGIDANWTGGKVGEGNLRQGLRKWSVRRVQPNNYEPADADEDRRLYLPDGSPIYDFAGHLYTWVRDDVQGDERGIVAKPFAEDSISITAPHPRMTNGMGWYANPGDDWSGDALIRGGSWGDGDDAGVFRLSGAHPEYRGGNVGFRCTL